MPVTHARGFSTFPPASGPQLPDHTVKIVYPTPNRIHLTKEQQR